MERENWKRSIWGTHNEIGKLVLILLKKSLVVTARLYKDELDRVLREKKNYKRNILQQRIGCSLFMSIKLMGKFHKTKLTLLGMSSKSRKSISYWERSVEKESGGVRYFYFTHYHCPGMCRGRSLFRAILCMLEKIALRAQNTRREVK